MNKDYKSLNFRWLWTSLAMMLMGTFALNAQCTVDCSQVNQNLNGVMFLGTFDGSAYYKRTAGDLTYHDAKALAESLGGTLPIVTSQAENDYITSVADGNVWLGLTDVANEGTFVWDDGTPLTFTAWSAGEPNNSNNEDFVELRSNGHWNDLKENHIRWVIVEIACPCIPTCDNVTDGGTINMGNNPAVNCGSYNPTALGSTSLPSGGSGTREYLWLSSTTACPTSLTQAIAGADNATYNPGMITETTYYVRCSRRAGCASWTQGESNCVTLTVAADYNVVCEARVNGGSYNTLSDCTVTVDAGDDLDLSVNPNGAASYQWVGPNGFSATGSAGGDIHVPNIAVNEAGSYTVTIDIDGCVKTQTITVIVNDPTPTCDNVTDGGTINMGNNPAVNCGSYNPTALGSTSLPSGGSGAREYLWLSSTTGCPTSLTQAIAGADNATYNPGTITETTYYVRCSRRAGCTSWTEGESNCVTLTVAPDYNVVCQARVNGGTMSTLNDCTVTVNEGDALVLSVNPNNYDSYTWTFPNGTTGDGTSSGNISVSSSVTASDAGIYTVEVSEEGCVKTQTITVIVNSVTNNLPTATNDSATTNENTGVTIPVTNNDDFGADGPNSGSIVITNNPNNGTATVDNNGTPNNPTDDSIVYTPNTGYTGTDVLTYIITDSNGDQSTATVDITINPDGGGNGPDCANISITPGAGEITVTGLDGAPVSSVQIFTATWQPVFSCFADCDATETITVPAGDYLVFVKYYEANYALVCQVDGTFTVTTGGGGGNGPCENAGGDSDGDNVCDNDDCAPNDPNLPAVAGTSCDDGNANTINDVITADGCGCEGTPDNGGGNGPDCNDIAITTGDGTITVSGLDGAPVTSVQIFTATWQPVFSCFADCDATETVTVPAGDYLVFVKYYEATYALVCQEDGTFTVTSGGGGGGNNLPSAEDDTATTNEDSGVNIPVTGNDNFGGDGPSTGSIAIVTIPGNGTATVNDNGTPNDPTDDTIDYVPNSGFTGTDTFTYVTTDSDGDTSTATVTVTVNGGGNGGDPDCANITITPGNGTISVTGLDGAPVSSVQVFTSSWQPVFSCFADCSATETINVTNGDYLVFVKYYDAGYGLICQVDGTFTVGAGNSGECQLTTTVDVSNVTCNNNGTPNNTNDDTFTFDVVVNAQAPAGVELWGWSYNSMSGPMYDYGVVVNLGPFPISGGAISFDVLDSDNASCVENVTVNAPAPCSDGNDVPVANNDSATTNMGMSVDVAVNGNDSFGNDGPSNSAIAITVAPNNGTASVNDNGTPNDPTDDFITYTPANGFFGTDELTYVITDSDGDTDTAVVTITVSAGAPDCANITITTDDNSITVTGLDGAPVSSVQVFTATWSPVFTCFADCDATVDVVVPAQGDYLVFVKYYETNYTLICQVDGTFTVGGGNNLPTAVNDSATTDSGVAVNVPVTTNDSFGGDGPNNGQILIVSNPVNGTATVNNNGTPNNPTDDFITYTPDNGFSGQDQLTYQITDSNGDSTTAVVTITVNAPNGTPTANDDSATTDSGVAVNVSVTGNDTFGPDGPNNGQIVITNSPSNGTAFVNNNGTPNDPTDDFITYTPNNNFVGTDVLTYEIIDSNGDTSSATVTITVDQPNGTPTANNDGASTPQNTPVNVNVGNNDTYGTDGPNNGQIVITNGPNNGTASVNNNGTPNDPTDDFITYTPNNGFTGDDTITYEITDANGDTDTATVTISVAGPTCDNVTDGGEINMGNNPAINCGSYNPSTLGSTTAASGGSGALEYIWLSSTTGCPTSLNQTIAGATNATYNPGTITQTTYYRRCARRAGCTSFNFGESNCITLTITAEPNANIASTNNPDCGQSNGSITFNFADEASRTNIEFSVDGGATYPLNVSDAAGSATMTGLGAGTYAVSVRWGNGECAVNLGNVTLDDGAQAPGTSCDDGNAATTNDVILANGCDCEGTIPAPATCAVRTVDEASSGCNGQNPARAYYANNFITGVANVNAQYTVHNGVLEEFEDGTATFTGTFRNVGNTNVRFNAVINLSGRTFNSTPKASSCYTVNPADFYYYTNMSGTLTGTNHVAGGVIDVTNMNEPLQLGTGGSLFDQNAFGASAWLNYTIVSQPNNGHFESNGQMDFNWLLSGSATECGTNPNPPTSVCTSANVLFVVGNTTLNNGDTEIKNRLENKGFNVMVVDDNAVQTSDSNGKDLIVISSTVLSTTVGDKFTHVAVPVMNNEPYLHDDLGYVGAGNFGADHTTQATLFNTGHPLVDGLSGTVNIFTSSQEAGWGTPAATGNDFAYIPGSPNKCLIIGWDTGEQMNTIAAPARRVGFFLRDNGATYLTNDGWRLFDNATNWLIGCPTSGTQALVAADEDVLNFTAKRVTNSVELNWANNTGFKNDYFVVEHSVDGINFEAITEKASANTSEDLTFYNVVDDAPTIGVNFYRVQLIFNDGTIRNTEVKEVTVNDIIDFGLYPNPTTTYVDVNLAEVAGNAATIRIVDKLGRAVLVNQVAEATANPHRIQLDKLTNGHYIVWVLVDGRRPVAKQLVVLQH